MITALNELIRRERNVLIVRGVCASCTAGIGAFLIVMFLDSTLVLLQDWPRWTLTLSAYACWAGVTGWYLVRPLTRSFTLTGMARLIETHHPELQERISSAVELLASQDMPSIRGSETLIQALTEEAVRETATLRPRKEISFRSAMPFGIAAVLVIAIISGLSVALPRQTGFLMARAVAPFLNLPNVRAVDVVVEPGDTLVAAGSSLQINVKTRNPAVTFARLRMMDFEKNERVADMIAMPAASNQTSRSYSVTLPEVLREFRYRVQAGDAVSRYFTVRVAVPPVITQRDIRYRYPDYAGMEPRLDRDGSGTIRALAGTEVTVSVNLNKAVQSAVMEIQGSQATNLIPGVLREGTGSVVYDFSLVLPKGLTGVWTLRLTDEIGLRNSPFEQTIQSIPDAPPAVVVSNPRQRELRLNRDTRLPVFYTAEDDLGLQALALVFTFPGNPREVIRPLAMPAPVSGQPGTKITGDTAIDLQDSLFTNAPRVSVRLRATDRLPADAQGPQSGQSDAFTIILDTQADAWQEQVLASQDKRATEGLKLIQQQLNKANAEAAALAAPLEKQPALTADSSRRIDALQDVLASAENALRATAQELENGFFEALATNLNALAEEHVAKAENLTGQIKLMDNPAERSTLRSNVTAEITTSMKVVEQAISDHDKARIAAKRAVELDVMSGQQKQLAQERRDLENADAAGATNAVDKAASLAADKRWAGEQDAVADDLAKMARETPEAAAHVAGSVSNQSVRAADEADRLARRQAELAALTREAAEQQQKQDAQWRDLTARQDKLAESARAEPQASQQADAMKQAAREMESGLREQARRRQAEAAESLRQAARALDQPPAATPTATQPKSEGQPPPTGKPDSRQELAVKAGALKAQQEKTLADKTRPPAEAARESARTAEQAGQLAEQAAQSAEKAAQQAEQSTRKAQEQADAAKATAQQAEQATQQAAQTAQQSQGKPSQQEAARAAEAAAQNAQAARENAAEAKQDAQDAKQNSQSAQREAQQARKSAEGAKQSAQQAAQQAQQAASADSPKTANQKQEAAAASAATAVAEAAEAAQSAMRAGESAQAAQQKADAAKLADLARRQEALRRESDAEKAAALKAQQEKTLADKTRPPAEVARESARTAEKAGQMAEQAAQSAEKAAQQAEQSSRKAQEQADAAKATAQQAEQAAQQAAQTAQQSQGKPSQQEAERAAEAAAQNAQAARENEAEARQGAQDAKQDSQSAQREAQQARKSAEGAKQSAQQAAQQAQQAASADSPKTANQKQEAAAASAATAVAAAAEAAQSAMRAGESAQAAQQEADSAKLADLARRQEELRRESDALLAAQRRNADGLESTIARQVEAEERTIAQTAEALAQAMSRQTPPEGAAEQTAAAARAARQAADELQQDRGAQARASAQNAEQALNQLAEQMRSAVRGMPGEPLEKQAALEQIARQAQELAEQQEQLGRQIDALAADRPLDALQGQQEQVGQAADDLAQEAASIQAQASEALAPAQGARPAAAAAQAAQAMQRARQAAEQAGQQMQTAAGRKSPDGKSPSAPAMQQAAQQAGQNQQAAAQAMQQAAQNLRQAAQTAAASPAQTDPQPLADAYQSAREAAQSSESADAAEAAAQLAQAAQQAAGQAQAMGVNPRPSTLQAASLEGGGAKDLRTESEELPAFDRRLNPQLRDWMRLHGELKDDVLQAINSEGPEEYRPIIQKYFREVSRHGEEK
jgi:hypothetical protein